MNKTFNYWSRSCFFPPHGPHFYLKNIIYSPHLIINLISTHHISIDNNISTEFDQFGCTKKYYPTGTIQTKCNSCDNLYPISTS